MTVDDDLPRTIRREREARERESARTAGSASSAVVGRDGRMPARHAPAPPATVVDFDVPFAKLTFFFIKAVFAAVPALIVLTACCGCSGRACRRSSRSS